MADRDNKAAKKISIVKGVRETAYGETNRAIEDVKEREERKREGVERNTVKKEERKRKIEQEGGLFMASDQQPL